MRAVLLSMTDLQILGGRKVWAAAKPRRSSLLRLGRRFGVVGGRAHQGHGTAVPDEVGEVRVITVLKGERVALPFEHDCLPPPVFKRLLSDHEMASRDFAPRPGQAAGGSQAVVVAVLAQRRLRFEAKGYNEVAIQRLPDVGHEPTAA